MFQMADDKKEAVKIVRVRDTAPVKQAPLTENEKEAKAKAYLAKCACVEMLQSEFDMSDLENPKQVGKKFDHYVDSLQMWKGFLVNHVTLNAQFIRVKYLPEGWPTVEQFNEQQQKLVAKYNEEQTKKAAGTTI